LGLKLAGLKDKLPREGLLGLCLIINLHPLYRPVRENGNSVLQTLGNEVWHTNNVKKRKIYRKKTWNEDILVSLSSATLNAFAKVASSNGLTSM